MRRLGHVHCVLQRRQRQQQPGPRAPRLAGPPGGHTAAGRAGHPHVPQEPGAVEHAAGRAPDHVLEVRPQGPRAVLVCGCSVGVKVVRVVGQRSMSRDAWRLQGKGPQKLQRRPQERLDRRLEEGAKAVGGGYCRLQMPLRLALAVRGTVAGGRLGALEGIGTPPRAPANASLPFGCRPVPDLPPASASPDMIG